MEDPPSFVLWIPALEPRRMEHCVTFTDVAATVQAGWSAVATTTRVLITPTPAPPAR